MLQNNTRPPKKRTNSLREPSLMLQIMNRSLMWIVVFACVVSLTLGYSLILQRLVTNVLSAAQQSLPAKNIILVELQQTKKKMDRLVNDYDVFIASRRETIAQLNALLPLESQYEHLFAQMNELSKKGGMKLQSITIARDTGIRTEVGKPAGFQEVRRQGNVRKQDDSVLGVGTLSVTVSVQGGGYESYKRYLEVLERNIRLFDVKSISFSGGAKQRQAPGVPETEVYSYTFDFNTYFQISDTTL